MTAPPIKLRSPADLLAVIPHLLGFVPNNAVVVVALKDNKIDLTQRMDLPDSDRAAEVAQALARHVLREEAEAALLVASEVTPSESLALLDALGERLDAYQVAVRDRIVVCEGRWRSLECSDPSCCPPEGNPVPSATEAASVLAEFVGVGSAPLADRLALADQLEPVPAAADVDELLTGSAAAQASVKCEEARRRVAVAWARVITQPESTLGIADVAVALKSLQDVSTRDGIAAVLIPSGLELETLPQDTQALVFQCRNAIRVAEEAQVVDMTTGAIRSRLIGLCRHATDEHAAPALTLLATFTWWHGDGALARVALDRALRCDSSYRLAQLLTLMLDEGIRPDSP